MSAAPTRPKVSRDLTAVSAADLRLPPPPGDVELPDEHGAAGDPRYPSPVFGRTVLAIALDAVLHLGLATAVFLVARTAVGTGTAVLYFLGVWIGLSLLHRIVVQRIFQTTLGKAVTGLRMIREDTGGRPTLWLLVRAWFRGLWSLLEALNSL
ncbi:MAG: RDD family protein [Micromonosporaceae bacterium]